MARLSVAAGRYGRRVIPGLLAAAALLAWMLLAAPPAGAQTIIDYDSDDDGLIEITTMDQFYIFRIDWNGDGGVPTGDADLWALWQAAFPNGDPSDLPGRGPTWMGCPANQDGNPQCRGYELMTDLDFDFNGDGMVDATDYDTDGSGTTDADDADNVYWNGGVGWRPIPVWQNAVFEGNGHVVRNLTINNSNLRHVGLFADIRGGGVINRLGLEDANVSSIRPHRGQGGNQDTGIVAGAVTGTLRMVYTTGSVTMNHITSVTPGASPIKHAGGLTGYLGGRIFASYSTAAVTGPADGANVRLGGLVGRMNSTEIHSSYASGPIRARRVSTTGGLVGRHVGGEIRNSYASGPVYGSAGNGIGGELVGVGGTATDVHDSYGSGATTGRATSYGATVKTARDLKRPTSYTGLFAAWNADVTGDDNPDNPWDFGTPRNFPLLRVDFNNDGSASCEEFGPQPCYREPIPTYNPAHDHPEIYRNARYEMAVACAVQFQWTGDELTTATLTFDLGDYTRPIALTLSLWDGEVFRTLQSQGLPTPELQQNGQTATVQIATDPSQTRFRIDSEYGLNLVLGYADCSTDDP